MKCVVEAAASLEIAAPEQNARPSGPPARMASVNCVAQIYNVVPGACVVVDNAFWAPAAQEPIALPDKRAKTTCVVPAFRTANVTTEKSAATTNVKPASAVRLETVED